MKGRNGPVQMAARKATLFVAAGTVVFAGLVAPGRPLEGQAQQASRKGIWEPVSYRGDIQFGDVFFVTADKGWVAGVGSPTRGGGVIMQTTDGGKTWVTQYGDPESSDRAIDNLFFLDERRGWARQGTTLLHTSDGETWEAAGTVYGYDGGYVFTSPTVGVAAGGGEILRTDDGGRSWAPTGKCAGTTTVGGLTKRESCTVRSIHFPSRNVGYAVGDGYEAVFYLMKTTDGGRSWTVTAFPAESGGYEVFFTDERRGFVRTRSRTIYGTDDGGNTWRRIAGLPLSDIKFADPMVGWSMAYKEMLYTTNNGRSWTMREIPFPGMVTAFSIPRRDRGYAVGDHGMIYRYSVVPATRQVAGALAAPLMPAFETLLDKKVGELDDIVESLEQSLAKMPGDAGGTTATGSSSPRASENSGETGADSGSDEALFSEPGEAASPPPSGGVTSASAAPASPFIEKCCVKSVSGWYLAMQAAETLLPQFVSQFKNTNLLGAGLRMLVVLPARANAASAAFSSFKRSQNKDEAKANLAQLQTTVDALKQGVSQALQKEVPST